MIFMTFSFLWWLSIVKAPTVKKKKKKPQRQQQQQQQQQQKNETCAWYEYITDWSKSYLSSFDVLGKMS